MLVMMIGLFIYFYITLNRVDNKLTAMQNSALDNSAKINAVVNFFNTNLNAQNTNQ
jgi:hypothetical protein